MPVITMHAFPGAEAIEEWLVARLAMELRIDPCEIDVGEPFAGYGMDSVAAAGLSGDLEDWLGRALSPTLVRGCPSIAALARRLSC